jgi:acetyl esterase/lipase
MSSLASKAMPILLALRGTKKTYSTAQATRDEVAGLLLRPKSFNPPSKLDRNVDLSVRQVGGWRVYEVTPKGSAPTRRALYLHGGAYIHEIIPWMWSLVAKTAAATSTRFTVPIYPLAPRGVAEHVVPAATDLAAEIIGEAGADHTALMGDSAGGGMTVAVARQLRDRGLAAPYRTVLISPWLDVSLTAPDISALAAKDHFLAPAGLAAAGELYRGELSAEDPRVSPINGDLSGLGPITLFSGTHDILHSDAKRFVPLAREARVSIDYHEAPGMLHEYPLFPIPEAKQARQTIIKALRT